MVIFKIQKIDHKIVNQHFEQVCGKDANSEVTRPYNKPNNTTIYSVGQFIVAGEDKVLENRHLLAATAERV